MATDINTVAVQTEGLELSKYQTNFEDRGVELSKYQMNFEGRQNIDDKYIDNCPIIRHVSKQ